jgi:hypothetical protein
MQIQWQIGSHLFGQTFQTIFRMAQILRSAGMTIYRHQLGPEFLVYARKLSAPDKH